MIRFRRTIIICAIAVLVTMTSGTQVARGELGSGDAGFGKMWTRTNPFVIMGMSPIYSEAASGEHVDRYWDTNHTFLIDTPYFEAKLELVRGWTEPYSKPWIYYNSSLSWDSSGAEQAVKSMAVPNLKGWSLKDEPTYAQLGGVANVSAGLRTVSKQQLVYVNMSDLSTPTLDRLFNDVAPDVLQYDRYPFLADGSTGTGWYFDAMMTVRDRAVTENVPYWAYLQSFSQLNNPIHRVCSESDMRMNAYSHLTAGYTGLEYYTQVQWPGVYDAALLDAYGNPDTMYWHAQDINAEVQNLGQALTQLDNTDVRFIAGDNGAPTAKMSNWSSGAGGDSHIINVAIDGGQSGVGYKNGMIGFFDNDLGEKHFMLTNLDHAANTTAAAASLDFTITFDSSVNSLLRLNRETGVQEVVTLTNHQLSTTLIGGTGDLYKYNTGDFLLGIIITPEPEVHYTFKETSPGTWEVYVDVTGEDTAGLSAYEFWVDGANPGTVSYVENTLGSASAGFLSANLLQSDIGGNYNVGNYQSKDATIEGIGMVAINEDGVVLDAQALLGTLTTEIGLTEEDFRVMVVGLLNAAGDGFYDADGIIPSLEVLPFAFLMGDANQDGVVSAADYSSVQANFGNIGVGILGDANGDGVVSAADYSSVQANFGNTAASATVPEPATMSLLALGITGLGLLRRHRKN